MMAYVTRYMYGTDKLRSNAFEVRGINGTSTGVIHCDDLAILSQWLKYLADNVIGLTSLQVSLAINIVYLLTLLALDEIVQQKLRCWRSNRVYGMGS